MNVSIKINKNNYEIIVDGTPHKIIYPKSIALTKAYNEPILQNIAFSLTWFFCFEKEVNYNFSNVFFKDFILKTCASDIPTIADDNNMNTLGLKKQFSDSLKKLYFKEGISHKQIFEERFSNPNNALLLLSFGKDSLLSFGLAKEIGLDVSLFFNSDTVTEGYELNKRKELAKKFQEEFNIRVYNVDDYTDNILESKSPKYLQDFQGSSLVLYYSLLTLPIAYREKARYIFVGNEQNFNDSFINKDGFKSYVTADQTSAFMKEASELLKQFTGKNNQLMSLIEPIYNLFEMHLLYSRYPNLLKYIMSCSSEELKKGHWCYNCPMCAKAFLYTLAASGKPKKMNFLNNMFNKEFTNLYPLFNKNPDRTYEKPPKVRDEQLLAFYMAYKNKAQGYLIERFKELYLEEAKERHEELYKIFFGIHPSLTMPLKIKQDVLSIYKEELNKM